MKESPRHQCFIYAGDPSAHLAAIAPTLIAKLKAKRRCLYLNSPSMITGMRWQLSAAGLDVDAQIAGGALILTSDQSHLEGGSFEVDRMLGLLRKAIEQSLTDGYRGLWASGDMLWEFGTEANLVKLLEYERRLEKFMEGYPAFSGICLYHRDTLPSHAIETAMVTHPSIYLSEELSEANPRYFQQAWAT